jgi:hypothetical protein
MEQNPFTQWGRSFTERGVQRARKWAGGITFS